jgi:hypothetical protein
MGSPLWQGMWNLLNEQVQSVWHVSMNVGLEKQAITIEAQSWIGRVQKSMSRLISISDCGLQI